MIGTSVSQNFSSGPWHHLTTVVVPQWIAGDFGLEWVTPPRPEQITNRFYFDITNKFGGSSRMYLDSLDVEDDAERKFKSKNLSLIHWTELSNFKRRATFDVLKECLRAGPVEQQQMIAETNPAEEGTESWIYKLWYIEPFLDLVNPSDEVLEYYNLTDTDPEEVKEVLLGLRERQSQFEVIEFSVDSNVFLTPSQKRILRAEFQGNPDLFDRYWRGIWTRSSGAGFFKNVIRPEMHFIGDSPTPSNPEPDILLPDEGCIELGIGFDIGSSQNTAISIVEPLLVEATESNGSLPGVIPHFRVLDEFNEVGIPQDIERIVETLMEKADFWEGVIGRKVFWNCWSDSSAFSHNLLVESTEAKEVYRLSGGRFDMKSVTQHGMNIKGSGAVKRGIDLVYRLLFTQRLVIGRAKCPKTIDMLTAIAPGRNGKLEAGNKLKHQLDALRYYLSATCWTEMQMTFRHRTKSEVSRVLATPL